MFSDHTEKAPAWPCLLLGCAVLLPGCRSVEAKAWNLDQLHTDESGHRYSGALESDTEYEVRRFVEALFRPTGATFAEKSPDVIPAPSDECLANLIALEAIDDDDSSAAAVQVEWFARLAVEDPWRLSRERATLALGRAGARLRSGLPAQLGSDQKPAEAESVAGAITPLVDALRAAIEGKKVAREDTERICDAIRALDLDLAGARRALRAVNQIAGLAEKRDVDAKPLRALVLDLERVCVRRALAHAIDDPDPYVRAAALRATGVAGGRIAIDSILFERMKKEGAAEPVIAILDLVSADGLSDEPASAGSDSRTREDWMEAIVAMLGPRPEGEVRVHAMRALARLSRSGLTSLREEDWQAWWANHHSAPPPREAGSAH